MAKSRKSKKRYIFPCGLQLTSDIEGFEIENTPDFREVYDKGCPLHGKKCKMNVPEFDEGYEEPETKDMPPESP